MEVVRKGIEQIKTKFQKIKYLLDNLDNNNIEKTLSEIESLIKEIETIKKELKNKFQNNLLEKYNFEMEIIIKEIKKKYDNILTENKKNQKNVSDELNKMLNEKKLTNYR